MLTAINKLKLVLLLLVLILVGGNVKKAEASPGYFYTFGVQFSAPYNNNQYETGSSILVTPGQLVTFRITEKWYDPGGSTSISAITKSTNCPLNTTCLMHPYNDAGQDSQVTWTMNNAYTYQPSVTIQTTPYTPPGTYPITFSVEENPASCGGSCVHKSEVTINLVVQAGTLAFKYDFFKPGTSEPGATFYSPVLLRSVSPVNLPMNHFDGFQTPPGPDTLVPCDLDLVTSSELLCLHHNPHKGMFYYIFNYGILPLHTGPFTGWGYSSPDRTTPSINTVFFGDGEINGMVIPPPVSAVADISADKTPVNYNTSTDIHWSSTHATNCVVLPGNWSGKSGSQHTGNLTSARTYTVSCDPGGPYSYKSVTVEVTNPPLSITVSKIGQGNVTSSPAGINCGAICSSTFDPDTQVTLTAEPQPGRVFTRWGGDCTGTQPTCLVDMNGNKTVVANFSIAPYYKEY